LLPEKSDGKVYWITSDNLLAYYALRDCDPTVSASIEATIKAYARNYSLPTDATGLPISYKHEAIIGDVLTLPFRDRNVTVIPNDLGYNVQTEVDDAGQSQGWQNYSDLVALKGLSYYNQGDTQNAAAQYSQLMAMWDGRGFRDNAYNDTEKLYDTYKIALALLLAKDLKIASTTETQQMINIISVMQDISGGIHTRYSYSAKPEVVGSVNTETTAITAIACR
jgi:hypothetical protein